MTHHRKEIQSNLEYTPIVQYKHRSNCKWALCSFGLIAALSLFYYYEFEEDPTMSSEIKMITTEDTNGVTAALSKFSTSLFKVLSQNAEDSENLFVSPFSIASVLSMAHIGAQGKTAVQMKTAMHLTDSDDEKISAVIGSLCRSLKGDGNYTLESANQLYVANNYPLTERFQTLMKNDFGAAAENVDFVLDETRLNINKWVEDFTHQKIKDLIPNGAFDALTRLTLVNAVYFKGSWLQKFDATQTKVEPFYLGSQDKSIDTEMMHIKTKLGSGYLDDLDARVLELPYVGGKLSMFIILPNKIDGMAALEAALTEDTFLTLDRQLRSMKIEVALPKFKVEAAADIKTVLTKMGISDLFDRNVADLSGISGRDELFVSDVFHKAFVEVNEEGSEAAAATVAVVRTKRSLDHADDEVAEPFIANRPCLLLIRHNPSAVKLFLGRLARPSSPVNESIKDSPSRDEL